MQLDKEKRELLKKSKYKTKKDLMRIGFVFKDMGPRQEYITFSKRANEIVAQQPSVSISCFFIENCNSALPFNGAAFHISDSWFMEQNLVATSFETLYSIKNCTNSNIILYLNDIEYERSWFKYPIKDLKALLEMPDTIIFRSKDHYNKLVQDELLDPLDNVIISDILDVELIMELSRNDKNTID